MKLAHLRYYLAAAGLLVVALLFAWFRIEVSLDVQHDRSLMPMPVLEALRQREGTLAAADTAYIEPWMTFRYLTAAFKLDPQYLSATLDITDPSYPDLSIARYARDMGTTTSAALGDVEQAVRARLSPAL